MQAWNTLGQRPAAVTNPVVRVCFCDGPCFTNAAMTVATATTNSAAIRFRRHVGLCPCLFRGTSLDQKKTLVVHPVVSLSHPLDHSVAHINRIKSHLTFLLQRSLTLRLSHQSLLMFNLRLPARSCCLILNNAEKNYCQAGRQAHPGIVS